MRARTSRAVRGAGRRPRGRARARAAWRRPRSTDPAPSLHLVAAAAHARRIGALVALDVAGLLVLAGRGARGGLPVVRVLPHEPRRRADAGADRRPLARVAADRAADGAHGRPARAPANRAARGRRRRRRRHRRPRRIDAGLARGPVVALVLVLAEALLALALL